ncbi:OmpH family outer membrane protein [Geobacter sp. SVR]|uniref:OmpH family outer membrane protein n=1 Tax=Geobacter sp. SVR TaxID=2495594 RepID=UPI00143EFDC9|nr:OmpH family outer membrane protein [Geobacter sp. SVR]BCS55907.1 hypothetical protein GSVR_42150 [Geobacter sp. SVR]GCF84670.1 OmpH outer membrane protein [Geobacter sp. SVR]
MISPAMRLLLALLVCALPAQGFSAETTAAEPKPSTTQQAASPADPVPAPKPATAAGTPQPLRLGYVELTRMGTDSELGKASRAKAQEKQQKLEAQLESKRKQLDKQKTALEAKIATMTPAQKQTKAKEFQKKVEEFQATVLKAEKELQSLQMDLENTLSKAVEQAATEYGKTNGLALVVVKRELLYVDSGVAAEDVTDGILKLMDAKYKK